MANSPEIRLITKVARLYHEQKLTQTEIAKRLGISQVTVSRLLKRAEEYDIVKTTVTSPPGAFVELEEQIEKKFNLSQVIIGEAGRDSEEQILTAIGSAAAHYLETSVTSGDVIGVSSWSASLLSMVEQMHPIRKLENCKVVQILGGLGNPSAEKHANHLVTRLARLVHGEALFLPAPGILGAANSVKVLLKDPYVKGIYDTFSTITIALVGIGSVEPSSLVASSGNVFGANELNDIRRRGAVGDICLAFLRRGWSRNIRSGWDSRHWIGPGNAEKDTARCWNSRRQAESVGHPRRPPWKARQSAGDGSIHRRKTHQISLKRDLAVNNLK